MNNLLPIVLINYNGQKDTTACIRSINENINLDVHIIVVDNHSDDYEQLEKTFSSQQNITFIRNKKNLGFAAANNIGINWANQHLEYDHLLILNNDTLITEGAIEKLIFPFKNDPKIGITTSRIMYEERREIIWYAGGEINYLRGKPHIYGFKKKAKKSDENKSKYVTFVSGCVMLFSKKCLDDLKGFYDGFFMYCEDMELCIRANKMGYKLYYVCDSVIYHKVGSSSDSIDSHKTSGLSPGNKNLTFLFFHMKSNQWITMRFHLRGIKFLLFNIIYWFEFYYKTLSIYFKGHKDILDTAISCRKKIKAFNIEEK